MSWCGVSDECGIALRRERSDEADGGSRSERRSASRTRRLRVKRSGARGDDVMRRD